MVAKLSQTTRARGQPCRQMSTSQESTATALEGPSRLSFELKSLVLADGAFAIWDTIAPIVLAPKGGAVFGMSSVEQVALIVWQKQRRLARLY